MGLSEDLRSLAVDMADFGFDHRVRALADSCHGDVRALAEAAESLGADGWPSRDRVAVIYLSAAYARMTTGGDRLARSA